MSALCRTRPILQKSGVRKRRSRFLCWKLRLPKRARDAGGTRLKRRCSTIWQQRTRGNQRALRKFVQDYMSVPRRSQEPHHKDRSFGINPRSNRTNPATAARAASTNNAASRKTKRRRLPPGPRTRRSPRLNRISPPLRRAQACRSRERSNPGRRRPVAVSSRARGHHARSAAAERPVPNARHAFDQIRARRCRDDSDVADIDTPPAKA